MRPATTWWSRLRTASATAGPACSSPTRCAGHARCGAAPPVISLGIPRAFIPQGKPDRILARLGLDAAAGWPAREAQAQVDAARRNAEKVIADARAEAITITAGARGSAEELESAAKRRYDEIVGSLAAKRASLQGQIEALEQFDQQYRARLLTFMQSQIRALWADNPKVDGELTLEDDA